MEVEVANNLADAELDAITLAIDAKQGDVMLRAVCDFLARFVAYPSEHARTAHALWCVHTHLMDKWESTPRIAFLSPEPASGKTRALEITELLVPHAVQAINVSPAYLFRKVGCEEGATILFDEIDTVFGPKAKENEEIRGLLNAGHRKGAVAGRCVVRGKNIETEEIPAYSAVALAGLGWLPDTILSRSVIIRMRRRHAGEKIEPFRRRIHAPKGDGVRSMIELWARAAKIAWPSLPHEIQDRDADVWEPLVAVADAAGGEWPAKARAAAVALVAASRDADPSLGIRLLADLRRVFGADSKMPSKKIIAELINIPESPWGDLRGKPLDERGLARRLKEYGIRSKDLNMGGDVRVKGYEDTDLHDAWSRYLPPLPATSATSATFATNAVSVAPVADVADLSGQGSDHLDPDGYTFNQEQPEMPDMPECLVRDRSH